MDLYEEGFWLHGSPKYKIVKTVSGFQLDSNILVIRVDRRKTKSSSDQKRLRITDLALLLEG